MLNKNDFIKTHVRYDVLKFIIEEELQMLVLALYLVNVIMFTIKSVFELTMVDRDFQHYAQILNQILQILFLAIV